MSRTQERAPRLSGSCPDGRGESAAVSGAASFRAHGVTTAEALRALAASREAQARAEHQAGEARAKALRDEAELLLALADAPAKGSPNYTLAEALALFDAPALAAGDERRARKRLLGLTQDAPFRVAYSKTEIQFERGGFDRWLSRGRRFREVRRAS